MISLFVKKAMLFDKEEKGCVVCRLCRHECRLTFGRTGICGVRKNIDGELYTMVFGRLAACAPDPIEKKPLFHFLPGTASFSIATVGCNFKCSFCQNHSLSQVSREANVKFPGSWVSPETVVSNALRHGSKSIAYTYSEPTIFFEYAYETSKLAHKNGLLNVFVSNGYMTRRAIDIISPYLDGINIDLKSFSDETYGKICGARLEGVLDTIKYAKEKNIWVEVTTLVVSAMNDTEEELRDIARFIASVGNEIPWHVSRFHPDFNMTDSIPTDLATLLMAADIGKKEGLRYVFTGNFNNNGGEDTICPECNKRVIERRGFSIMSISMRESNCRFCGCSIDGVWK